MPGSKVGDFIVNYFKDEETGGSKVREALILRKKVFIINLILYLLLIFVGGTIPFIEYMLAIPAGIIAGVPTIPVIIVGFAGNLISVILLIWLFDYVLAIRHKRKKIKIILT